MDHEVKYKISQRIEAKGFDILDSSPGGEFVTIVFTFSSDYY